MPCIKKLGFILKKFSSTHFDKETNQDDLSNDDIYFILWFP